MNDPDILAIRRYLRPSLRLVGFSAGFCFVLFLVAAAFGRPDAGLGNAALVALASAAVLGVPVILEWRPYIKALGILRAEAADPARRDALVRDFAAARDAFQGELRVGGLYLYGRVSGALVPRRAIRRIGCEKRYYRGGWSWQVYAECADCGTYPLNNLRRQDWPEEEINVCLARANALLAEE